MVRLGKANWSIRLCLAVLAAYIAAAAFGEYQYRTARAAGRVPEYNVVREECRHKPPSLKNGGYVLGTDNLGRSVFLRLMQGTRIAFHVGILTSLIAMPLGIFLGCLGGYVGGKIDAVVIWLCATVSSIPSLLLILAISAVVGKGLQGIYWGIGLTTWVGVCRNIRAETIKHRDRTYVNAARLLGYSTPRILFCHILPNIMHVALTLFAIRFPSAIGTEVFVSFLGIGVQGEPSWGVMLNDARNRLWQGAWWEMASVSLAIFGLVLVFNVLADKTKLEM